MVIARSTKALPMLHEVKKPAGKRDIDWVK
jgi:hypothetical protein